MGCLKLTYYPETELKTVTVKKALTLKISVQSACSSYLFGFNGKEKDDEMKGEGNSVDFGARIYDSRLGRWLSLDPESKKGPAYSPFSYSFNSPILFFDPDGQWPVFTHYRMTYNALIKKGVDKQIAKKIAYYSATYADGAKGIVLIANQFLGIFVGVNPGSLAKKPTDDHRYDNSQADNDVEMATVHAMRAFNENITSEQAVKRAEDESTAVFDKYSDVDINSITDETVLADIGVAFHKAEDVSAHNGKRWVTDNKDKTKNKNEHGLLFSLAETFTMSRKQAKLDTEKAASNLKVGSDKSFELPEEKQILGSEKL